MSAAAGSSGSLMSGSTLFKVTAGLAAFAYAVYKSVDSNKKAARKAKCHGAGSGGSGGCDKKDCKSGGGCGAEKKKKKRTTPNNIIVPTIPRLPQFSSASVIGHTIYVSGTLGVKPWADGQPGAVTLVDGGLRAETKQTMDHIATALKHVIAQYAEEYEKELPADFNVWTTVAKVNVYLRDTTQEAFKAMNEEYLPYFAGISNPPARMTSAGVTLARDAAVEIECVAQLPFKFKPHHLFGGHHSYHGFGHGWFGKKHH